MVCILVAGPPASGKSTLAKALSKRLSVPMFSKDSMKEVLFDTVGFRSREEKVALGLGAMELLYYAAGQILSCGGSVILENNFENASRPGLEALLARFQCRTITLLLKGDPNVLYDRFVRREASPERHRGHVVNTRYPETGERVIVPPLSYEQYVTACAARGMADFSIGEKLEVDVTDFSAFDLDKLQQWLEPLL